MPKEPLAFTLDLATATYTIQGYKTFDWKDQIKALGGKWNPQTKTWSVPQETDLGPLVCLVEAYKEEMKSLAAIPRIPAYGQCCAKAKYTMEYDQGPAWYSCPTHGARPITKKGFGYTGD